VKAPGSGSAPLRPASQTHWGAIQEEDGGPSGLGMPETPASVNRNTPNDPFSWFVRVLFSFDAPAGLSKHP
jgi:hypothetical protein